MSEVMKIVGERLRAFRRQRKWSQMQLAEKAGLHPTYIGRIERGENNVTVKSLEKVAVALQVPFEELFRFIDSSEQYPAYYLSLIANLLQGRDVADQKKVYELITELISWKDE